MYVMHATFRAKPGQAQALADKFTAAARTVSEDEGFHEWRVLIDHVADFWTVVFEASFDDVDDYFSVISRPQTRVKLDGYLDLVESGHRRLYRVASEG